MIIHVNRNFHKDKKERIYSLPDINSNINQIFIDNLNCNRTIDIKDLLSSDIKKFLEEQRDELKFVEFDKTLKSFLNQELIDADFEDDLIDQYINDILKYMTEEKSIKDKINEIVFKFIDDDQDNEKINCKDIIDIIYTKKYINIFNKYLRIILKK